MPSASCCTDSLKKWAGWIWFSLGLHVFNVTFSSNLARFTGHNFPLQWPLHWRLVFHTAAESHRVASYQCFHHYCPPSGWPVQRGLFETVPLRDTLCCSWFCCAETGRLQEELEKAVKSQLSAQTWDVQVIYILTWTHIVDRQLTPDMCETSWCYNSPEVDRLEVIISNGACRRRTLRESVCTYCIWTLWLEMIFFG